MLILDCIVTVFQGLFVGYGIKYCLQDKSNLKTAGVILLSIIFSSDIIREFWNIHNDYFICTNNFILMFIVSIFYRKDIKRSLTAFSIINILISIYIILASNIVLAILRMHISESYLNYELALIVYIPQIVLIAYLLKNKKIIESIYKDIINQGMEISTIIVSNVLIFIVLFYRITAVIYSQLAENLVQIIFALGLIGLVFYFQKIHNKSRQILALNNALEEKNKELRKIKHDYGAQISYLYGLVLMNRHDELKKALKNIIDVNQNTAEAVEVNMSSKPINSESVLQLALKPAIEKGINVILEENFDSKVIKINEMDLYRIVSNIVDNAIKAMDGSGTIIVKAYEIMKKVIIEISNNGPMIPKEHVNDIFSEGFTTKNNEDKSHGYGLSIVKELVERYEGKITVKSNEEVTVFKICFNII